MTFFVIAYSILCAVAIITCYLLWTLKNFEGKDILKDFVDVSPVVILAAFYNVPAALFLLLCLCANEFIYDNVYIGAVLFMTGYFIAGFSAAVNYSINYVYLCVSAGVIAAVLIPLFIVYKGKWYVKLGAGIYGIIAFIPCLYAFFCTWNIGFILLFTGDLLLAIKEVKGDRKIGILSDCIYFVGTCLVPLSLCGYWN